MYITPLICLDNFLRRQTVNPSSILSLSIYLSKTLQIYIDGKAQWIKKWEDISFKTKKIVSDMIMIENLIHFVLCCVALFDDDDDDVDDLEGVILIEARHTLWVYNVMSHSRIYYIYLFSRRIKVFLFRFVSFRSVGCCFFCLGNWKIFIEWKIKRDNGKVSFFCVLFVCCS